MEVIMLKLIRNENGVFYNDRKLTIVAQATKGPGKEVVKIEGLPGSDGAKWISLNKLSMGENVIEPIKREVAGGYALTDEEKNRIDELQGEIDAIKARARQRNVNKGGLKTFDEIMAMDEESRVAYIRMLEERCEQIKKEMR
jgi:hypothetical protein